MSVGMGERDEVMEGGTLHCSLYRIDVTKLTLQDNGAFGLTDYRGTVQAIHRAGSEKIHRGIAKNVQEI